MPKSLVECIANYSEARRPEVVEAIMQAITSTDSVQLLDRHSDLDHNRTVLTFVGPPQAVEEAAFRSIATAGRLIDLDHHTGEHPRIGATDVVPFVPISGVTMQECVELARHLGQRVGEELDIPVYLYEEAATRPERQNLENIRHGQYEGLKNEIASNPDRAPDFGPARLSPAGATVIGARRPLIAFNVYLTTDDVSIAKHIAKAIRFSSGGLRYLKASGFLVNNRAQVSMNLTNYRETPIARVVEMIRCEAVRYGVSIHHSELVGLAPEEAFVDAATWYLQLDQFEPDQILERRMDNVLQAALSASEISGEALPGKTDWKPARSPEFLEALASGAAAPGGGSAAAYTAAEAAALVAMVARLTIGKKKYVAVENQMLSLLEQAESLRAALTSDVERDAASFEVVMAAYKLPKESPEEQEARSLAIEQAISVAAQVPLEVARKAVDVIEIALQMVSAGNLSAITDAATGALLAQAALQGAGYNVQINSMSLKDRAVAQNMLEQLQSLEEHAADLQKQIRHQLIERGGLPLA